MIRPLCTLALVAATMAVPAHAGDPRLVTRMYDEDAVVRIEGRTNVQATVAFADDERIENVAIGDSASWQVTPNKRANLLFVKPLEPTAATNMTVVTDRRTYYFDLVASPRAKPLYQLRFAYPEEPVEDAPARMAAAPGSIEMQAATDPLAVTDPASLNFAWGRSGDAALLPERAYDDGEVTYLAWPQGRDVPAILVTNADGREGPVNFTVRGENIIIEGVPGRIILRSGDNDAFLVNNGPPRPPRKLNDAALARAADRTLVEQN
ncbi:TrbG/VirB9 family P-type conjugative transfer protein [Croceicoccus hydrothermalis]|uniref:TrbG/VirB9 family P-type conjugative transfer protein n=1 Tax=Croceicoccus hydrothermalis TaxID=2867964 RepID=UPI001EFBC642|nr:TrbG/VirB9 family P-type conjugative transfer protein [Croceicoccus hydrothermalis]